MSLDAAEQDVRGYASKIGTAMPELDVASLDISYALAFDAGKTVKTAFQTIAGLLTIGSGFAFLVDTRGTIVWREAFTRSFMPSKAGQLRSQIPRVLAGLPPEYRNGPRPVAADDSDSEADMDMGGADLF